MVLSRNDAVHHVETWLKDKVPDHFVVEALEGGASNRRYCRVSGTGLPWDVQSAIAMVHPATPLVSEELGKAAGRSGGDDFLVMARWMEELGMPVPRIYEEALDDRIIFLEDLGSCRLYDVLDPTSSEELVRRYTQALKVLVSFQKMASTAPSSGPGGHRYCDEEALRAEFEHFIEYGIEARQGVSLGGDALEILLEAFEDITGKLATTRYALAHRDFQSQNLMVRENGLTIIDFQDAFMAPPIYDLVALLRDSYVVIPPRALDILLDTYHRLRMEAQFIDDPLADRDSFDELFNLQTVQRKLKDAGRFEYIAKVKGNPAFLRFYGASVGYAMTALEKLGAYSAASDALKRLVPEANEACDEQPN